MTIVSIGFIDMIDEEFLISIDNKDLSTSKISYGGLDGSDIVPLLFWHTPIISKKPTIRSITMR